MTASVDAGRASVDDVLRAALAAVGVAGADATELARLDAFGGSPAGPFVAGLRAAAALLCAGPAAGAGDPGRRLDWGALPAPWDALCPGLLAARAAGGAEEAALGAAVAGFDAPVQGALLGAISAVAARTAGPAPRRATGGGAGGSWAGVAAGGRPAAAEQLARYLEPIDESLVRTVQRLLHRKRHGASRNRKEAGEHLLEWLATHGRFIRTPLGARYYLHRGRHRVFRLGTDAWHAWLYRLTGANPAGTDFRYFAEDCAAAAEDGDRREVVRLAHWDEAAGLLRVSRFDGSVYRLDGVAVAREANGDGPALFDDSPVWLPYEPDFAESDFAESDFAAPDGASAGAAGAALDWSTRAVPHWDEAPDEQALLHRTWWLATFFTELCPTRPILVFKGEKGSAKTTAVRVLLRLLFGPLVDVCGVPEKRQDFVALASNSHVVALDNLDEFAPWLRDELAAIATGKEDQVRELYTTNDVARIRYRCWVAITSRTPDTLQRDDVVDRTLLLSVSRLEQAERRREKLLHEEVTRRRNRWWGDTLTALNAVVAELRRAGLPERGELRMEDWAALGAVAARAGGQEEVWRRSLERVRAAQGAFLLEDDVVTSGIETWLASPQHTSRPIATRDLYEHVRNSLFGPNRPDATWPRSVKSFGRRLAGIRRELAARLAQDGVSMTWRELHGNTVYEFVR